VNQLYLEHPMPTSLTEEGLMSVYAPETIVRVYPYSVQDDGDDVVIGRPETGTFLAIPRQALEVLDLLRSGNTIAETSAIYQRKYDETPDLGDFLALLEKKGIVAISEQVAPLSPVPTQQTHLRYHFSDFPQSAAQILFGRWAIMLYLSIIVLGLIAIIRDPSVGPHLSSFYFPDRRALSWIILTVLAYSTVFVHELSHLVAARSRGISSRLGIGHRLWNLVAETDMTGLWGVPKRERYLPLIAGSLTDAVSGCVLILLLQAHRQHWVPLSSFWAHLVEAMIFIYTMRIAWELSIFVRTDFYYVVATATNCKNLLGDTESYLQNLLARVFPRIGTVDLSAIPNAERKVIHFYAFVWAGGRIFALFLLWKVTVPVAIFYSRYVFEALRSGYSKNPGRFVDALTLSVYFLIPLVLGFILWVKTLSRRYSGALRNVFAASNQRTSD
jgi:putative peptide zinc metalloprotease protein